MKVVFLFFVSDCDPNGKEKTLTNISRLIDNTGENVQVIAISNSKERLDISPSKLNRLKIFNRNFKNILHALLGVKDELSEDVELIFIPTPGDEILVDNSTIEYFLHAYAITKAGFIISNHFEIISGEHRILQKLKSGDDPSNIIIPGRQNNPMLFCHGSIIAISREYINENVINPDVNFGYDYALRMGVLGEKGSIFTINTPTYSFKRGRPFYPGAGLQEKFKKDYISAGDPHFSYIFDPARFEWCNIIFKKYLKKRGYYLPENYFSKPGAKTSPNGISFVMPTYNRGALLKYGLDSFLNVAKTFGQSVPVEMVIVDNGNDNTPTIVKPYTEKYPKLFQYYKVSGLTLGAVRNFGVKKSKYNIIGQLDSDDVFYGDPVIEIFEQFKKTNAAMIIGTYKTASRDPETGELILDDQTIVHDEFLVHYNNPLLQFCIPGPGAPRYYRKEVLEEVGGFPDLLYGEDSVLSDKIIKEGYIIKRNLSSPKYIAVRHGANTDAQSISLDLLIEKNRAKYLARASIMEEIKHIIDSNPDLKKCQES